MSFNKAEYLGLVSSATPKSKTLPNVIKAFAFGGAMCVVGQLVSNAFQNGGLSKTDAGLIVSLIFITIGVALTMLGVYDKISEKVGAGITVPITGFANSLASAAMEFRAEGSVAGMAVKMFIVAGPVIVFGITASVVYGVIYVIIKAITGG